MKQSIPRVKGRRRQRLSLAIGRVSWVYLIGLCAMWLLLRTMGDVWWIAMLMLFGPLWVSSLPLAFLTPLAVLLNRRALGVLAVAAIVCVFALMGYCVPWKTWLPAHSSGRQLRVLSCNLHENWLDITAFRNFIIESRPDVIVMQEASSRWGHVDPDLGPGPWIIRRDGELYVASKFPIVSVEDFGDVAWQAWGGAAARYVINSPDGPVKILNVHLASPHMQFLAVIDRKRYALKELERHMAIRTQQSEKFSRIANNSGRDIIVAGDFNTIAEGSLYSECWSEFDDAFSTAGLGIGHTYFGEGAAVRIDHILSGSDWRCRRCLIGPYVGSPHRPLVADLQWAGKP